MKNTFQCSAQVRQIKTLVDGGNVLTIDTQELKPDDMVVLFQLKNKQIWCAFKETEVIDTDITIPDDLPEFKGEKSPSKRLKDHVWQLWDKCTNKNIEFETYWRNYVNKHCNAIKEKLP